MLVGGDKLDDAPSLSMDKLGTGALLELGAGGLLELGAGGLALDGTGVFTELGVLAELVFLAAAPSGNPYFSPDLGP